MTESAIRMVLVQFSFSNPKAIPKVLIGLKPENTQQHQERKQRRTGVQILAPVEDCSVTVFSDLRSRGFQFAQVNSQERIDAKDPLGRSKYWMVRAELVPPHFFEPIPEEERNEFKKICDEFWEAFMDMCQKALWRVRAFNNPYYQNHEEVPGQRTISINLEARKPLFLPTGEPIRQWFRDDQGRRIGNEPFPIKPARIARFVGQNVEVVPA